MKYVIKNGCASYVCKGSYVFQGERYKTVGRLQDARLFSSRESAEKELSRLQGKYQNIDSESYVLEIGE